MKKSIISIFLVVVMLVTMVPFSVLNVSATTTEFAGGTGTELDPYLIETKEHLDNVRNHLDSHYKMIADIEFASTDFSEGGKFYNDGLGWKPIGINCDNAFVGTFEGNSHTISGLQINFAGATMDCIGLFGYNKGLIHNVGLADGDIKGDSETVSLIIGTIAGYNDRGTISNCYSNVIVASNNECGGIVGKNYWGIIKECYNVSSVSSERYAGGIVSNNWGTVLNCYNAGNISANYYVGGISACNYSDICNCYNVGELYLLGNGYCGGITGSNNDTISNCFYSEQEKLGSGKGVDVSVRCSLESLQTKTTYESFDFESVWKIENSSQYPFPILKQTKHTVLQENIKDFKGGTGTLWDPYLIETKEHLNNVRNFLNAHYKMVADIIFTDKDFAEGGAFYNNGFGWEPIGVKNSAFSGSFDGDGHSIIDLNISSNIEKDICVGLFGYISGNSNSKIKNLNITNCSIYVCGDSASTSDNYSYAYIGTIVGYGSVINCNSSGQINIEYTSKTRNCYIYAGGINGYGNASDCTNACDLMADIYSGGSYLNLYIGGITGRGQNVSRCKNFGTLSVESSRNWYSCVEVGGIAGCAYDVTQCGNVGNIVGVVNSNVDHLYIGGILGRAANIVDECYNTGFLDGTVDKYIGGIVGYLESDSTINNSFNSGAIINGASGGIAGFCSSGTQISNCYNIGYIEAGYGIGYYNPDGNTTFNNCFCLEKMAINQDCVRVCSEEEMLLQKTFVGFDFDDVWQINNNGQFLWPELMSNPIPNNFYDISTSVITLSKEEIRYRDIFGDFTVSYDGKTLVLNEDYIAFVITGKQTLRIGGFWSPVIQDVGFGTLFIVGIGDFCGVNQCEFNVEKCDISTAKLMTDWVYNGNGSYTSEQFVLKDFKYDGTEKVQSGYRVCDNYDVIDDMHFEVTYKNNVEPGTATMIITGVGDYYTGILEKEFTIYAPVITKNGWQLENCKWAYYQNNVKATNKWLMDSVGWCYVGEDGYCVTNCWKADSHGWCYLDANGRMVCNNWVYDNGKWYFMDANGYMVSNCWKKDSKGWCYLGSSGAMLTNAWVKDSVGWYYVGADGYCVTNKWVKDSKGWCYLDSQGRMVYNKWVKDSVGWCYVGSNGYMVTSQWVKYNNQWYYLDANGYMVTGTRVINGKTYKFNSSGVWIA